MASGLRPSDPSLLYAGTSDDPRLGDRIERGIPLRGGIALLGFADDRAIVNGRGRAGAAAGPGEMRRFLSRLTPGDRGELDGLAMRDLGDAPPSGSIEETHALVEEAALEALHAGACVVLLGGGPGGFSAADLFACARAAGADPRVRVLDVMELSPPLDQDGRTARLAAMAIWSFLAGYAARSR